jgi:hypothetical protein
MLDDQSVRHSVSGRGRIPEPERYRDDGRRRDRRAVAGGTADCCSGRVTVGERDDGNSNSGGDAEAETQSCAQALN